MYDFKKPVLDFTMYENEFTWNKFIHFPVPTSMFVANTMGIDLITHFGSETQANKQLIQIAKMAKDYLMSRLPFKAREFQEFRLSREINAIYEVLEYQMAFIIAATTTGAIFTGYEVKSEYNKGVIAGIEQALAAVTTKFRTYEVVPPGLVRVGY